MSRLKKIQTFNIIKTLTNFRAKGTEMLTWFPPPRMVKKKRAYYFEVYMIQTSMG